MPPRKTRLNRDRPAMSVRGFADIKTLTGAPFVNYAPPLLTIGGIRHALETRGKFPKDDLVYSDIYFIQGNPYLKRDRKIDRAYLWALTGPDATDEDIEHALAQANCWPGRYCNSPWACLLCKHRFWLKRRERVRKLAEDLATTAVSHFTLILGVTHQGVSAAREIATVQGERFRRLAAFSWPTMRWAGMIEVDYLAPFSTDLGTWKKKSLKKLGYEQDNDEPALVPHLHLVLAHPGIDRELFKMRIKQHFKGPRRTRTTRLDKRNDIRTNLDNLSRYSTKARPPKLALPHRSKYQIPREPSVLRAVDRMYRKFGGLKGLRFDQF